MALFRRRKRMIRRLLIVEDEPFVAFENEHVLEKAGYDIVATVDHGEVAIAYIEREAIDAIVLDIHLAGDSSGIDVARVAAARGIAILFVSGQFPPEAATLAHGVLAKPYSAGELVAAIAAVEALVQGQPASGAPGGLTLFNKVAANPG